jgi:hypothetical protein
VTDLSKIDYIISHVWQELTACEKHKKQDSMCVVAEMLCRNMRNIVLLNMWDTDRFPAVGILIS